MTRAVAAKELRVLWASPLPYAVGAALQVVLAWLYTDQLAARGQAVVQPLFPLAGFLLVVSVPVVAMRTFAEEARTGTLDLLQAVPVAPGALVAGKWLATWVTSLAALAPASGLVALVAWFGDPDPGPVVTGTVGLVLLGAALAGVGVAASSLTSSQALAAAVAMFAALLLWLVPGGAGPGAGAVVGYLSLSERLRGFAAGVVDTADAAFLVLLTGASLAAAHAAVVARGRR